MILLLLGTDRAQCQMPGTKIWQIPTPGHVSSSPAVADDGTVYVGVGNELDSPLGGWLFSISPQGTTNWFLTFPKHVRSSPAIGPDGTIYVGCMDGQLKIISPSGTYTSVDTGGEIPSSPALGSDGTIYVGSVSNYFNKLYAIRPDGTTNWVFSMGPVQIGDPESLSAQSSSPAIGPDGTIYVGSIDKHLYAVTAEGKTNWVFPFVTGTNTFPTSATPTYASPSIGADGTIYIGVDSGTFYAIDPQGRKKWEYYLGSYIESSAAISSDGTIYAANLNGNLNAFSPDGTRKWSAPTLGISASPAIGADGNIYVGSLSSEKLYCFNSTGSNLWTFSTSTGEPGQMLSSPAIGTNGSIYFGSGTRVFAVSGTRALMTNSWPMFRRNLKHTARTIQRGISNPITLADGSVALDLTVEPRHAYLLESSANLMDWQVVTNFVPVVSPERFIDATSKNSASRFFRLGTEAQ